MPKLLELISNKYLVFARLQCRCGESNDGLPEPRRIAGEVESVPENSVNEVGGDFLFICAHADPCLRASATAS